MSYTLSFPVTSDGAVRFDVTAPSVEEFITAYLQLGGNADWLVAQVKSQVGKAETGQALVVVADAFPTATSSQPSVGAVPSVAPEPADPWATSPSPSNGFPADTTTAAPFTAPSGTVTVTTPNGNQTWQMNPPNAPTCLCGNPAAFVVGAKKAGGTWKAYRCSKGAGQDWKSKCEFSQWA